MWKCVDTELQRQIHFFPYVELSDVPRLQQVEKKAIERQRNLGLQQHLHMEYIFLLVDTIFQSLWFLDRELLPTRKLLNQGFLLVKLPPRLGWPLWNICVINDHEYVPLVVSTSQSFPRSWLISGFVTRLTWQVSLVEQELPTLPEHLNSPLVFNGVRVTSFLVLYVCFIDLCLSFCLFSFGHCVVSSYSIYGFWLPLWYLQTLHTLTQTIIEMLLLFLLPSLVSLVLDY
jgi:hypothetical protein